MEKNVVIFIEEMRVKIFTSFAKNKIWRLLRTKEIPYIDNKNKMAILESSRGNNYRM